MEKERLKYNPDVYDSPVLALEQVIETNILSTVNTCEVVRVVAVDKNKHTLTVIPVVKDVDSGNKAIEESNIYNVKYFGWIFGDCKIEGTPKEDDIGFVVVSKRDISNINGGIVTSRRKYNLADGIYFGGLEGFNSTPKHIIKFDNDGITIDTEKELTVNAKKDITVNSDKDVNINATNVKVTSTSADIIATNVNLGGVGGSAVARVGDTVQINGVQGTIITGSSIVMSA